MGRIRAADHRRLSGDHSHQSRLPGHGSAARSARPGRVLCRGPRPGTADEPSALGSAHRPGRLAAVRHGLPTRRDRRGRRRPGVAGRFETSGLTLAALQGGRYVGADDGGDRADRAAGLLAHGNGRWSTSTAGNWMLWGTCAARARSSGARTRVHRRTRRRLARQLPRDAVLYVTADHGMVDVAPEDRVDFDAVRNWPRAVGAARRRGTCPAPLHPPRSGRGRAGRLAGSLGDRMWILSREEAIEAGWFGPRVDDRVRERIGDVVAAPHARWPSWRPGGSRRNPRWSACTAR